MTVPAGDAPAPLGANRLLASALLLFMGAAWGAAISLNKLATINGGHPVGVGLWQTLGAGTIMLVMGAAAGRLPSLAPRVLSFNAVCGLTGLAFPVVGLVWAARYLPAGLIAIAFASMPLFTYGLTAALRIERIETLRIVGVLVGLAAIALIVLPDAALPGPELVPWVLLVFACTFSMSLENTWIALRWPPGASAIPLACGRQYAAAAMLVPLALALDAGIPLVEAWTIVQWSASGAAVCAAFAYAALLYVINTAGPVFASQSAYLITLAGVFWGMLIFSERHSPYVWAALCLMLLGLTLVRPKRG
jgi:drug/metabolite transporter (DMT)-like permease